MLEPSECLSSLGSSILKRPRQGGEGTPHVFGSRLPSTLADCARLFAVLSIRETGCNPAVGGPMSPSTQDFIRRLMRTSIRSLSSDIATNSHCYRYKRLVDIAKICITTAPSLIFCSHRLLPPRHKMVFRRGLPKKKSFKNAPNSKQIPRQRFSESPPLLAEQIFQPPPPPPSDFIQNHQTSSPGKGTASGSGRCRSR